MLYEYDQLERINQNLICCLCHSPFVEPVQTPCAHVFCASCVTTALSHSSSCPVDRRPLDESELVPAAVVVRNMVDELLVRCSCAELVQRQDYISHRKSACSYALVSCGCGTRLMEKDMDGHSRACGHRITACADCGTKLKMMDTESHLSACPSTPAECRHCSRSIPRASVAQHASACLLSPAMCTHASNGCSWEGERSRLSAHLETCPFDALKAYFAIQSAKMSAESAIRVESDTRTDQLRLEMESVRRELDGTKKQLGDARQEISTLHTSLLTSLGPYAVSPSTSPPPPPPPPLSPVAEFFLQPTAQASSSQDTTLRLPFVRRRSLPSSHYLTFDPSVPPSDDPQSIRPLPSILGASGPPMPMRSPRAGQSPERQTRPLPFGQPQPPQYFRDRPPPPPPTATDRSRGRSPAGPIETNFKALAETVTDVVRAMDSLERKSDLMLTAETLRLMEEIGALRSITHSIRMQLHHITMNLNSSSSASNSRRTASRSHGGDDGDLGIGRESVVSTAYSSASPPRSGRSVHVPFSDLGSRRGDPGDEGSEMRYRL